MSENTGKTDRELVNDWLDRIGENDQACRDEVLKQCKNDPDARRFYVQMARQDVTKITDDIARMKAELNVGKVK